VPKKVAIIGFSRSTRDEWKSIADKGFEFWGMNNLAAHVSAPWSRWFEMHTPEFIEKNKAKWPEYPEWLKTTKIPVYMQKSYPEYPSSMEYPIKVIQDEMDRKLNSPERKYFSSTVAYALMAAWVEEFEEIHIYGADMVKDTEYGYQRPNCEYLIGLLRGSGVKVHVPERSALLSGRWMYGYEERPSSGLEDVQDSMNERIVDLDNECKALKATLEDASGNFLAHLGALKEAQIWSERIRDALRGASL
jgi:hypothetical protein